MIWICSGLGFSLCVYVCVCVCVSGWVVSYVSFCLPHLLPLLLGSLLASIWPVACQRRGPSVWTEALNCCSPRATVRTVVGKEEQANGQPVRASRRRPSWELRTEHSMEGTYGSTFRTFPLSCSLLLCAVCYLDSPSPPSTPRSRGGGTLGQARRSCNTKASPIDRSSSSLVAGRHALAARKTSQHAWVNQQMQVPCLDAVQEGGRAGERTSTC